MKTADIVIIGGGVVRASFAYQLGRRGAGPGVVVLETSRSFESRSRRTPARSGDEDA